METKLESTHGVLTSGGVQERPSQVREPIQAVTVGFMPAALSLGRLSSKWLRTWVARCDSAQHGSPFWDLLTHVGPRANSLHSLNSRFLLCKMGIVTASTFQDCWAAKGSQLSVSCTREGLPLQLRGLVLLWVLQS